MKVAIIGAGFTGLSAAYELLKQGHEITIFEKDSQPGGLAIGYQEKRWEWSLEKHYHHWFTNDTFILGLAKEIGYKVVIKRPKTSVYVDGATYQLDSPRAFLTFPKLSLIERVRMVVALGLLRIDPFWKPLERVKAHTFLPKLMGKKAYDMLWGSQLTNKMGKFSNDVSLVWFWSRIVKRSPSLAYPKGGFLQFTQALAREVEKKGGKIIYSASVTHIQSDGKPSVAYTAQGISHELLCDKIIVTLPSFAFLKLAPQLPKAYTEKLSALKSLGATNLVLRLTEKFLPDNIYWLSICDTASPVMVAVEHTNFMDKKYYNKEHLVYLGKYMPITSDLFAKSKEEMLAHYDPFLRKLNPTYAEHLVGYELFKAPFAQPIVPINYSKMIPPFDTPLPDVYLANIEQVYPWDRGTNYAVELGQKIAKHIL